MPDALLRSWEIIISERKWVCLQFGLELRRKMFSVYLYFTCRNVTISCEEETKSRGGETVFVLGFQNTGGKPFFGESYFFERGDCTIF